MKKLLSFLSVLLLIFSTASSAASWNTFYTGTLDQVNAAIEQINANCGFPDACSYTWAVPRQAYEQDFYFIQMPPPEGYMSGCGSWTQEQMIAGVVNVEPRQSNSSWWPPYVPPAGN